MDLFNKSEANVLEPQIIISPSLEDDLTFLKDDNHSYSIYEKEIPVDNSILIYHERDIPNDSGASSFEICIYDKKSKFKKDTFYLNIQNILELKDLISLLKTLFINKKRALDNLESRTAFFIDEIINFDQKKDELDYDERRLLNDVSIEVNSALFSGLSFDSISLMVSSLNVKISPYLKELSLKIFDNEFSAQGSDGVLISGPENIYVLEFDLCEGKFISYILLYNIWKSLELEFNIKNIHEGLDRSLDLFTKIFNSIPYPCALSSEQGELILHNYEFDQLEVLQKDCLLFADSEIIERDENYFKVVKKNINISGENFLLMSFFRNERANETGKENTEELGIISSSIAHELNNPIAGILAACSLLELDDEIKGVDLEKIEEMKNSAKRIKKLVDIFLGFSRGKLNEKVQISLEGATQQAIELLKFRMVESNIKLNYSYKINLAQGSKEVNGSTCTMILYIILSELLTNMNHLKLLGKLSQNESQLRFEEGERLELMFPGVSNVYDLLYKQKLLKHLLNISNISLSRSEKSIQLNF